MASSLTDLKGIAQESLNLLDLSQELPFALAQALEVFFLDQVYFLLADVRKEHVLVVYLPPKIRPIDCNCNLLPLLCLIHRLLFNLDAPDFPNALALPIDQAVFLADPALPNFHAEDAGVAYPKAVVWDEVYFCRKGELGERLLPLGTELLVAPALVIDDEVVDHLLLEDFHPLDL